MADLVNTGPDVLENEALPAKPPASREQLTGLISLWFCLVLLACFAALWFPDLGASFSNDYDEGVYLTSARAVVHGQPLFKSVFSSQPPMFIEILAFAFRMFGDSVETGRGVISFFALVSLAASGVIAWRIGGPLAAPLAILGIGISVRFFPHARTCQAEIPAMAFSLMSFAMLIWGRGRWRLAQIGIGGILFALGGLSKLLVAPMIVPAVVLLMISPLGLENCLKCDGSAKSRHLIYGIVATVAFGLSGLAMTLIVLMRYDLAAIYDQAVRFHTVARGHGALEASNISQLAEFGRGTAGLCVLAMIGLLSLSRRKPVFCFWLCLWIGVSVAFLYTHRPLFARHCMLLLFPVGVAASASAHVLPVLWRRWHARPAVVIGLCLALITMGKDSRGPGYHFGTVLERDFGSLRDSFSEGDLRVVKLIQMFTKSTDLVVSDEQMQVYRAGRLVPPQLCDTSWVRITSHYLRDSQVISAARDSRMIILSTDRLSHLSAFVVWVGENCVLLERSGEQRVYLRRNQ